MSRRRCELEQAIIRAMLLGDLAWANTVGEQDWEREKEFHMEEDTMYDLNYYRDLAHEANKGKNILASSESGCDDGSSEEEPVTLCIAAACRTEVGDRPTIVLCCDERGDRGLVSADASDKIRWVGDNTSVMLAGPSNDAQDLYMECLESILSYDSEENPDEVRLARLRYELEDCAKRRKKAITARHVEQTLVMSLDDFHNHGRVRFGDAHYQDLLTEVRMLNLGAHMLVCTFNQDNGVIYCVTPEGRVLLQDHYAAIGSGGPIADAFYVQRPFGDYMKVRECVYRVFEAKVAAEKNPHVGDTSVLEIITHDRPKRSLTKTQFDFLEKTVLNRLAAMPKLEGLTIPPMKPSR